MSRFSIRGCPTDLAWAGTLLALSLCLSAGCKAPQQTTTPIDTSFLREYAETWGYTAGQPTGIDLTPKGDAVLFLRSGPRDVIRNLYEYQTATGQVRSLLRAEDLLQGSQEKLTAEEKARRERKREIGKGLTWYSLSDDGEKILTGLSGRLYIVNRTDGQWTPLLENPAGPAMDAKFSPDGRFLSCIRGYDLYVTDTASKEEHALTTGGTQDVSHGVAEFVAQEEMDRREGYWWSRDSQWLAYEECDQRDVEKLYIADARNPESSPQGWRYPRAGRTNARVRLGIISVTGGETRWIDWDRERYPYMATVRWGKDSPLTIYVQTRDQHEGVLLLVDHLTGKTTQLLKETDPAWLNLDADMPRWLAGEKEFLWTTERSGQWEIELRGRDGALKRTFKLPEAMIDGIVAMDQERREFVAQGSEDPTQSHLYRISIDKAEIVPLTQEPGSHSGKFSKDGSAWVETASLPDGSSRQFVRGRDMMVRGELPSVAETPPFAPRVELTSVSAEGRRYHAAIIRPRNFVPSKKYPVIVYVYGGPHANVVTSAAKSYLRQQWIADQGFVVVAVDGRGTPKRGRAWERTTAGDLIDAPLDDQAAALEALGKAYGELDLSRVGIYGWSFGGYFSTMAVLRKSDVFHAAVAGAPVIDWEDYDTYYTERYMGLPRDNADGYRACSALTYADQLERPLLLIHGTTDDNVYFTHTLKMAESLFRAGRPYGLLVLPGFTHMVPEPVVTMRLYERIVKHFRHYLIENPPQRLPRGPKTDAPS